jgi:hypothetical protein
MEGKFSESQMWWWIGSQAGWLNLPAVRPSGLMTSTNVVLREPIYCLFTAAAVD